MASAKEQGEDTSEHCPVDAATGGPELCEGGVGLAPRGGQEQEGLEQEQGGGGEQGTQGGREVCRSARS